MGFDNSLVTFGASKHLLTYTEILRSTIKSNYIKNQVGIGIRIKQARSDYEYSAAITG